MSGAEKYIPGCALVGRCLKFFSKVLCDTFWHFYVMIIRKNTPLYGGRGVPSPARKHANVFRSAFREG